MTWHRILSRFFGALYGIDLVVNVIRLFCSQLEGWLNGLEGEKKEWSAAKLGLESELETAKLRIFYLEHQVEVQQKELDLVQHKQHMGTAVTPWYSPVSSSPGQPLMREDEPVAVHIFISEGDVTRSMTGADR